MDFYKQEGNDIIELTCSADYSSLSGQEDTVERSAEAALRLIEYQLPENATWVSFIVEELRAEGTKDTI